MIMKSRSVMSLRSSSARIFLARLKKSARSLLVIFLIRKSRSGSLDLLAASSRVPTDSEDNKAGPLARMSTSEARYMACPTGAMM